jgi:serine/threonine protein kinase
MAKLEKLIGQTLDSKYLLDKLLGQGGMGAVFLATHLGTKRPVALKVIAPQFMANEEVGERFRREAEAAGRLRHPNVVNVTDFGVTSLGKEQIAYLVMEYLDGRSLGDMLKEKGRLPLNFVVDVVEQICLAIGNAHQQGIIHRDLKPDNIWLQPDGRGGYLVKVLDFGLAKLRDVSPADEANEEARLASPGAATKAISNAGRDTLGVAKTTQPQYAVDADRNARTLSPANPTVEVEAQTQVQSLNETEGEAATLLQAPAPTEVEAATLMQPAMTALEEATRIQMPAIREEEKTRLFDKDATEDATQIFDQQMPEEATRIFEADDAAEEATRMFDPGLAQEDATRIFADNEEDATRIQPVGAFQATDAQPAGESAVRSNASSGAGRSSSLSGRTSTSGNTSGVSVTSSSSVELTRIGSILGTPLYMSPEQCLGELLDPRSDIYSLGVIIYQMLAGATPFTGSMMELMDKHQSAVPPSLKEKCETIPTSVSNLVMAALEKSPEKRPRTAETFANALRATAESEADLLRQTKSFYYSNQRVFFLSSLTIYLPLAFLSLGSSIIFNAALSRSTPIATTYYVSLFLVIIFATRMSAAICTLILNEQRLTPTATISFKPIVKAFARHLPALLATTALSYAKALVNLLKLIIPGWRAYVDDALFPSVVVLEGKRNAAALARSKHLVNPLRALARGLAARDLGISTTSVIGFPCIMVLMMMIFDAARGNAFVMMKVPMVRNFVAGYCWFLLTLMNTIYAASPLAMLYFKARQASGERLDETTAEQWQFEETQKRPDRLSKATIVWFSVPLALLAFMVFTALLSLNSPAGGSLVESVRNGRAAAVKRLLARGANANERRFGSTALMYAAQGGHIEVLKELLGAGARVEDRDSDGDTALIYAAIDNRLEALKALLEAGAQVNARNDKGQSALSFAAQRGRLECARELLARGADVKSTDSQGKTAYQYAEAEGHAQIAELLKTAGADQ